METNFGGKIHCQRKGKKIAAPKTELEKMRLPRSGHERDLLSHVGETRPRRVGISRL